VRYGSAQRGNLQTRLPSPSIAKQFPNPGTPIPEKSIIVSATESPTQSAGTGGGHSAPLSLSSLLHRNRRRPPFSPSLSLQPVTQEQEEAPFSPLSPACYTGTGGGHSAPLSLSSLLHRNRRRPFSPSLSLIHSERIIINRVSVTVTVTNYHRLSGKPIWSPFREGNLPSLPRSGLHVTPEPLTQQCG